MPAAPEKAFKLPRKKMKGKGYDTAERPKNVVMKEAAVATDEDMDDYENSEFLF